jgi:hypothetical protein
VSGEASHAAACTAQLAAARAQTAASRRQTHRRAETAALATSLVRSGTRSASRKCRDADTRQSTGGCERTLCGLWARGFVCWPMCVAP